MRRIIFALTIFLLACSDSPTEPVRVRAAMNIGCSGFACTLDASSSVGNIAHYRIDYGDGEISWLRDPIAIHLYKGHGTYRLGLIVIGQDSQVSEWTGVITL